MISNVPGAEQRGVNEGREVVERVSVGSELDVV